jgi:hypothetical protein
MFRTCIVTFFISALTLNVMAQSGQPVVKYGGAGSASRIVEMSNMLGDADGMRCLKIRRPFIGTIVKRDFDDDETMIVNITLRDAKDERIPINIDDKQVWLLGRPAPKLLSSLLGKGRKVSVSAYECNGGGSGVFYYAAGVKAL